MADKSWLKYILEIFFSAVVSFIFSSFGFSLELSVFIGTALFLVMVIVNLFEKNNELREELERLKKRFNEENSKVLDDSEDGNNLLFMALTQDFAEPLRVSLLEKSATKYNNLISALLLGNIYGCGVEKDGITLLDEDKEKAFEIYKAIEPYDIYGVSQWMLGWYYQNSYVEEAKKLDDNKRLMEAKIYYEKSMKKGFPKAMNSLGNFIIYGYAGFDSKKDIGDMISYYKAASEKGDNYAVLNYGHYFLREYANCKDLECLNKADELYSKATEMKSPESFVKLGVVKLEKYKITNDHKCLEAAAENFIASLSFGTNQFVAAGYFMLGNLLKQYMSIFDEKEIREVAFPNKLKFSNLIIECYVKSYEIFLSLTDKKIILSGENKKIFKLILDSFQNLEVDPLNLTSGY